ncbi:MAG: hypothetical protein LBI77_02105 [Puniceicoccales bacterium]|jgi:tRNA A37 threonylcarbamoyladenosine modification protein TsaB|nr:hypothetical protein [Puniceicoccales bacterium]
MTFPSLLVDASTALFQGGVLEADRFSTFQFSPNDTLVGFFNFIAPIFNASAFDEIIFCEGPGKLIGIRATLMFTRVLKVIHPHIKIYSYNTLALAQRILNGHMSKNRRNVSNFSDDYGENNDPQKLPKNNKNTTVRENFICVRKNTTQYYIFQDNQIRSIDRRALESLGKRIHLIITQRDEAEDPLFIPLPYSLESYGTIIREIITENEAVESAYDPQNEYVKWKPLRHKNTEPFH